MTEYKVIKIDNYAREAIPDKSVREHLSEVEAECVCEWYRAMRYPDGDDWYVVAKQNYVLWRGMEEFV